MDTIREERIAELRAHPQLGIWADAVQHLGIDPDDIIGGDAAASWFLDEDNQWRVAKHLRLLHRSLARLYDLSDPDRKPTRARPYLFKGPQSYFMIQEIRERIKDLSLTISAWAFSESLYSEFPLRDLELQRAYASDCQLPLNGSERERAFEVFHQLRDSAWQRRMATKEEQR